MAKFRRVLLETTQNQQNNCYHPMLQGNRVSFTNPGAFQVHGIAISKTTAAMAQTK